jgi:hypothetical protein
MAGRESGGERAGGGSTHHVDLGQLHERLEANLG